MEVMLQQRMIVLEEPLLIIRNISLEGGLDLSF